MKELLRKNMSRPLLMLALAAIILVSSGQYQSVFAQEMRAAPSHNYVNEKALSDPLNSSGDFWSLFTLAALVVGVVVAISAWAAYVHYILHPLTHLMDDVQAIRQLRRKELLPCKGSELVTKLAYQFNAILSENKKLHTQLLAVRSRENAKVNQEIDRLQREMRHLRKTATTDPLSQLANRALLSQQLPLYLRHAQMQGSDLSCLMIDVDNFKSLNDSRGHQVGDELIRFIGELLSAATRAEDLVCRYGGDEFVMLLPDCSAKDAAAVAERIRRMFVSEARRFKVNLGMSIGVASIAAGDGATPEDLIKRADDSAYRAKQGGRNHVVAWA